MEPHGNFPFFTRCVYIEEEESTSQRARVDDVTEKKVYQPSKKFLLVIHDGEL
jgi:hypothetical protein